MNTIITMNYIKCSSCYSNILKHNYWYINQKICVICALDYKFLDNCIDFISVVNTPILHIDVQSNKMICGKCKKDTTIITKEYKHDPKICIGLVYPNIINHCIEKNLYFTHYSNTILPQDIINIIMEKLVDLIVQEKTTLGYHQRLIAL